MLRDALPCPLVACATQRLAHTALVYHSLHARNISGPYHSLKNRCRHYQGLGATLIFSGGALGYDVRRLQPCSCAGN